jgi:anti-sigma-K factor RskA
MSSFTLVIALLLSIAYWRQVVAALAAGAIVLTVLGLVYVLQIVTVQ